MDIQIQRIMRKIPLINFNLEIGDILYCEEYCSVDFKLKLFLVPVYARVINKVYIKRFPMYSFHIMTVDGSLTEYRNEAENMIEHLKDKFKIFKLELNREEKAKLLLMGL